MIDWRALFERMSSDLSRAARRRGLPADAAEDLSQDAFLRLLAAADGGDRYVANPRAYLRQTGRNLLIDARRRDLMSPFVRDAETAVAMVADDAPTPERTIVARERLARVRAAIDALPPRARRAFVMHRLEDRTLSEIGGELGLSTTRVWTLIREAYSSLADEADGAS